MISPREKTGWWIFFLSMYKKLSVNIALYYYITIKTSALYSEIQPLFWSFPFYFKRRFILPNAGKKSSLFGKNGRNHNSEVGDVLYLLTTTSLYFISTIIVRQLLVLITWANLEKDEMCGNYFFIVATPKDSIIIFECWQYVGNSRHVNFC